MQGSRVRFSAWAFLYRSQLKLFFFSKLDVWYMQCGPLNNGKSSSIKPRRLTGLRGILQPITARTWSRLSVLAPQSALSRQEP